MFKLTFNDNKSINIHVYVCIIGAQMWEIGKQITRIREVIDL